MKSVSELIELFRQGTEHLSKAAESLDCPWTPNLDDPRKLHNIYARSLIACYMFKFSQLSETVLDSVENQRYLVYALAGRSLIEITATLRYYVLYQYKPLMDKNPLTPADLQRLLDIDDRHLRGRRFDWDSFFFKRYQQLKDDAVKHLTDKKAKQKYVADGISEEQVNVLTCVEKWAVATPEVLIAYNLFCDLVHPNIGSSFLVASIKDNCLYFTPSKGDSVGNLIFQQSFPLLVSLLKQFGDHLTMLMGTIWQDDEL